VMSSKQVRPADGTDHPRIGRRRRIAFGIALALLTGVMPARCESLSAPTKLSLSPLPAPTTAVTTTAVAPNHFSLTMEPRPKNYPATNGITAGSGVATRRVLEAATYLKLPRVAANGGLAGLLSTQAGHRGFSIAGIQAGYGMAFMDEVFTRGRNGTAMQEPSYIVVKTSLKF
jgi:hypothetical protein